MIGWLNSIMSRFWGGNTALETIPWQQPWSDFLNDKVAFYRVLSESDKILFHQRVLLFLQTTVVEAGQLDVTDEDKLLVAARL